MTAHEIDAARVAELARQLRVTRPIDIHWMTPAEETAEDATAAEGHVCGGFYTTPRDGRSHVVKVRRGLSAEQTSESLVHELVHCAQAERFGSRGFAMILQDRGSAARVEAEAYATATGFILGSAGYKLVRRAAP